MYRVNKVTNRNDRAFWLSVIFFSSALGFFLWLTNEDTTRNLILIILGSILTIVILRFPIIGFGILIVSTPIVELLPRVPIVSSILIPLGALTLFAFIISEKNRDKTHWRLSFVEALALLYIFWVFLSNPNASFYGANRNWILTFAQLWILMWMAKRFIRSENDHRLIMIVVILGIIASAIVAVREVGIVTGLTDRATGLSGGANTAARYFVYGIVLLGYLQNRLSQQPGKRFLILAGIVLLLLAFLATGSRSGLLLLGVAFFFLTQRFLVGRQRSIILWLIMGGGIVFILTRASGTVLDPARILDAVLSGSDTVGSRYDFWRAGWAMWQDHPIFGVGIGRYGFFLPVYWSGHYLPVALSAHSTYVQILSETGAIGFILVTAIFAVVINNFRLNIKFLSNNMSNIYWTWLVITILLLIGAVTKTEFFDKFLWFLLGISANKHNDAIK